MVNQENYKHITQQLSNTHTTLIAVSKLKPVADIKALYDMGHRDFGENYVQELVEKAAQLPKDIRWHFIGHLQSNKVKYIAPFVHLIHGIDSFKLLNEVNKQAAKNNSTIHCLLQVFVATETTKFGMDEKEIFECMEQYEAQKQHLNHVQIDGIMGMASFTENEQQLTAEFEQMAALFEVIKRSYFIGQPNFQIKSMGMSNDYPIAIAAGATHVRIGSLLFGNRG